MGIRATIIGSALALVLSTQQAAVAAPADAADRNAKVTCREIVPLGTLVGTQLVCMSRAAWNKNREQRRESEDFSREYLPLKEPARADMMQLGRADWAKMPQLKARGKVPYLQLVKQAREMLRTGACTIPGQTAKKFDIVVNYGVKFDAAGKVSRVLVEDSGCAGVNALVGLAALARADRGDYSARAGTVSGWHADRINLTLQ